MLLLAASVVYGLLLSTTAMLLASEERTKNGPGICGGGRAGRDRLGVEMKAKNRRALPTKQMKEEHPGKASVQRRGGLSGDMVDDPGQEDAVEPPSQLEDFLPEDAACVKIAQARGQKQGLLEGLPYWEVQRAGLESSGSSLGCVSEIDEKLCEG